MTGVSMEEFGPVSVDYFNGRKVESLETGKAGEYQWAVKYEGGGVLANYSPTIDMPPADLVGKHQTMLVLGANQTVGGKPGTLIYFGDTQNPRQYVVLLDPIEYAIMDPGFTGGVFVYAQRSNANMPSDAKTGQEMLGEDDDDEER